MSAVFEPDQALQQWRDQIDENGRLQQFIADQRSQIEDLARLNHDALFEANRYKSLYEIASDDARQQTRIADHRGAALEALASVATDMARSLTSFAGRCIDAANVEPPAMPKPQPPAQPLPQAPPPPQHVDQPRARPVTGPEDGVTDLPAFLSSAHVTPLPAVTP